jgi:hypothetical protein
MSDIKNSSFYDTGQIFKEVHDFHGKNLRVSDSNSVVNASYSHFRVEYTQENLPSKVSYFRGTEAHRTTLGIISDQDGSLQSAYITLFSAPDNKKFHLWFNVDELGIVPVIEDSTPIEVPINSNDDASIIAVAVSVILNAFYKTDFAVSRNNSVVEIKTVGLGLISNSEDFGTGFVISNTQGAQELISSIDITYEGENPVYKGQVLKGYRFNVFTGKFEHKEETSVSPNDVAWDQIVTLLVSDVSELYQYKFKNELVQDVLVTYEDESKRSIVSIQKTRY